MAKALVYTDQEKEVLNPIAYAEFKNRGIKDFQICKIYRIRREALKKYKKHQKERSFAYS